MNKKKLKIAVQIYGHLRTYNQCLPNLKKHLLDYHDCDVFIHTWDTLDHTTKAWHSLNEGKPVVQLGEDIKIELNEKYQPKSILMEKQDQKNLGTITMHENKQTYSIFGIECMLYTMSKVNLLRENYQKESKIIYDFVLCTRADIFLNRPFLIEEYSARFSGDELNNKIFVTGCQYSSILNDLRYFGGKDLLYFAKPNVISNLYTNADVVMEDVKKLNERPALQSILEYFFYQLIIYSKYQPLFCNYFLEKDYEIKRLYQLSQPNEK